MLTCDHSLMFHRENVFIPIFKSLIKVSNVDRSLSFQPDWWESFIFNTDPLSEAELRAAFRVSNTSLSPDHVHTRGTNGLRLSPLRRHHLISLCHTLSSCHDDRELSSRAVYCTLRSDYWLDRGPHAPTAILRPLLPCESRSCWSASWTQTAL